MRARRCRCHCYLPAPLLRLFSAQFESGASLTFRARERPHLIFDEASGAPSHLLTGVGNPGCGGNTGCPGADHTYTLAQPLKLP